MSAIVKEQADWDSQQNRLANAWMALDMGAASQTTPGPPPEVAPDSAPEVPAPTPTTVPPPDHSPDPNSVPQPHAVRRGIVEQWAYPIITIRTVIIANLSRPVAKHLNLSEVITTKLSH
jgi:hypothetical protein